MAKASRAGRSPTSVDEAADALRRHLDLDVSLKGSLQPLEVARITKPGRHSDGNGLYLQVTKSGSKSWTFRYQTTRAPRRSSITSTWKPGATRTEEMGLGTVSAIGLSAARTVAAAYRRLLAQGIDPLGARQEGRMQKALDEARAITFKNAAEKYIAANKAAWRNEKHAWQWSATLEAHAYPVIGNIAVQDVDTEMVMRVLEPIWSAKTETAVRVRGRVEAVLNWATAKKLRVGENPARWRGHLQNLLPRPSKISKVKHHPAMDYKVVPAFLVDLARQNGIAAQALQFTILCAARTNEIIGARWSEFDLDEGIWIVPPHRMKADREHRVPLSARAIEILQGVPRDGEFVFPGGRPGKPLSNVAMLAVLRRMKCTLTVHGFRSSFRDWVGEETNYPSDIAEAALAHVIGNKTSAAYQRGDLFRKRSELMAAWANYTMPPSRERNVIQFPA